MTDQSKKSKQPPLAPTTSTVGTCPTVIQLSTVQLGYSECKQTEPLFCDR